MVHLNNIQVEVGSSEATSGNPPASRSLFITAFAAKVLGTSASSNSPRAKGQGPAGPGNYPPTSYMVSEGCVILWRSVSKTDIKLTITKLFSKKMRVTSGDVPSVIYVVSRCPK